MISKKRYWGLALPIYDCASCGTVQVIGGRDELRERAIEGWEALEGHTPHRPYVDAVAIACSGCGAPVRRIPDVGNPWLDAGIVPFSTIHYREDPDYWAKWYPADFITESFPGQFRNWFYAMLAMGTVLRREPPFRAIFGYALLFGEDGRPMHKSWGNAIDFDEAAERMGVDVMRWIFTSARPDDNINFGWHTADEARRELLVLWNVYAFFTTYARLTGEDVSGGRDPTERSVLDRWILSRAAGTAAVVEERLRDFDAMRATEAVGELITDLSTWYLRLSRERMRRGEDGTDRRAAFATLRDALVAVARVAAPIIPFLTESMYQNLVARRDPGAPDSVHLTAFPSADLAPWRAVELEREMAQARRAVELIRKLRSQAGIRLRQPLARAWLALPGEPPSERAALLAIIAEEANVQDIVIIDDESELVDRRVKPLLPVIGRTHGARIPAIMAAARANEVEYLADGSVSLAGVILAPHEVEILAEPRAGTAVAHDEGLVAIIDTELTADLVAAGDARELARAIFDQRRVAELALDDRIEVWFEGLPASVDGHLDDVAREVAAETIHRDGPPPGVAQVVVELDGGQVTIGLRALPRGDGRP
jgi:isoleucyl-tRNA synthetase